MDLSGNTPGKGRNLSTDYPGLSKWGQSSFPNGSFNTSFQETLTFPTMAMVSACLVAQSRLTFVTLWTIVHQALLPMGFSRQEHYSGLPCLPPGDLPDSGIKPRSPALQADSLPSELPGKPMNTEVSKLSLLQGIFPTQEVNRGFLHCRCILYQLSWEGSPLVEYKNI